MKEVDETEIAWLAGLWDGEGSIGICLEEKADRPRSPYYLVAAAQLSMTHKPTTDRLISLLGRMGIRGVGYTYQERDPAKHLDAHYVHVARLLDINLMARALLPYSVTKREQWQLILEYTTSRLYGQDVEENGRVIRGQKGRRGYSEYEIGLARALKILNARGPGAVARSEKWLLTVEAVSKSKS